MGEIGIKPECWVSPEGITVIYQEIAHTYEIFTKVYVRAGQFHDPLNKPGIAHMTEHLVIDAMPNPDGLGIFKVHDIGSMFDYPHASTGITETSYSYRFAGDDAATRAGSYLKDLLWVMQNPHLDSRMLQREKNRLAHELGLRRNSPDLRLYDSLKDYLIGLKTTDPSDQDVLFDITEQDILDFMKKHYRSENIVVSIAGKAMDYKSIFTGKECSANNNIISPRKLSLTGTFNHHIAGSGYGAQHFLLGYKISADKKIDNLYASLLMHTYYERDFSDIPEFSDLYITPKVWEVGGPDAYWHTLYGSKPETNNFCYQENMHKNVRTLCTREKLDSAKADILFYSGSHVYPETVAMRLGEYYMTSGKLLDYDAYSCAVNDVRFDDFTDWIGSVFQEPNVVITA